MISTEPVIKPGWIIIKMAAKKKASRRNRAAALALVALIILAVAIIIMAYNPEVSTKQAPLMKPFTLTMKGSATIGQTGLKVTLNDAVIERISPGPGQPGSESAVSGTLSVESGDYRERVPFVSYAGKETVLSIDPPGAVKGYNLRIINASAGFQNKITLTVQVDSIGRA